MFFFRSNPFTIFQEGLSVRRTNMFFPGGSMCSSNRHKFSRRVYRTDNRHVFSRRFYLFVEQTLLSHRTDTYFPAPLFSLRTHTDIQIFQEPLFSHQTDISRKPYLVLEHIYDFPEDPYATNR